MNPKHAMILDTVARDYGFTRRQLLAHTREWDVCKPRQMAIWLCRRLAGGSKSQLAKLFERSPETIRWAISAVENDMQTCVMVKSTVEEYVLRLQNAFQEKGT